MRASHARSFGLFCLICVLTVLAGAEPVKVRYAQGSSHGFLALKTLDGRLISTGESTQTVHRGRVTSRLTFHFLDGFTDDDVTILRKATPSG